jgi:hypothetical protein
MEKPGAAVGARSRARRQPSEVTLAAVPSGTVLLDTRLVRLELARLRTPRAAPMRWSLKETTQPEGVLSGSPSL